MSQTVWGAFNAFRVQSVDLLPTTSNTARSSRDYLFEQLKILDTNQAMFPDMIWSSYLPFGSFARKTKIRPLDDIDIMILLNGAGTELQQSGSGYTYLLKIKNNSAPLGLFHDGQGFVNSTRILNQIKSSLASVKNYRKAETKRTQQAVVLNLSSYEWVFDIVPAIAVNDWSGKVAYYVIPNGTGGWIRTDPRRDGEKATAVNVRHGGNFLPAARILKYWNRRTHKPRLPSYYFEILAQNFFSFQNPVQHLPSALHSFFQWCQNALFSSCPDPKGLGPALDESIDWSTKAKVQAAMREATERAEYALMYERLEKHKEAIYWWREIFGSEFPTYG